MSSIPSSARVVADGISFPESPRWRDGALYFSDIHGHTVYRLGPEGKEVVARIDDRVSGLGFMPDGSLLAVSMLDRRLIAVAPDGTQRVHADLLAFSHQFINDMVVDNKGRAYVGSRNGGGPASKSDSLLLVDTDGSVSVMADDMVSPNGTVITPDGKTLIIAETAAGRLTSFAIHADGTLHDRGIFADLPGLHMDGTCLDRDGGIWAGGGGHGLLHIAPDGSLIEVIEFPGRMALACSLGGADGRTLFVATVGMSLIDNLAFIGFDRTRDAQVNSEGRIEAMTVAVPGSETI
ncbi:MAG: Gluconolactonase [Rhodospirillales bacterium]|nr:Gluconolactonase [Rhodospirillales bacterium]